MLLSFEYCFSYTITARVVIVHGLHKYYTYLHGLLLVTCVKKKKKWKKKHAFKLQFTTKWVISRCWNLNDCIEFE